MKFIYPAVIRKLENGYYRADFPDLCGCYAEGKTMDDAIDRAKEAEREWIELELSEELPLPPRSDPEEILLSEGALLRNLSTNIRLFEGYDE